MNAPRDGLLPDAPSCGRNREPILSHLKRLLADPQCLLEIGSGTGQHAVYFAPRLPHVRWQTTDRADKLPGIRAWLEAEPATNLLPPLQLDVSGEWPPVQADTIFTANTFHIMSAVTVEALFRHLPLALRPGGRLIVYGPVKIGGEFVGQGNAAFDQSLRQGDPDMGIRDLEWLDSLAEAAGLRRTELNYLPANNQLMVWHKTIEGS
ncbi:DUF938 domain-containing protein [Microbulbifer sp. TYP-18]|uniref:DUF938 domain-containing protein n=1 Tax=Microbulbifer sp. TYP-18 TaxID=3230024 RepID=UPI0034C5E529